MDISSIIGVVVIGLVLLAIIWQVRQKPFENIPEPTQDLLEQPAEYYYPELKEITIQEEVKVEEPKQEAPITEKKVVKKATTKTAKKSPARKPKVQ